MKRNTRNVIIVATCAASLGVATLILTNTGNDAATASSSQTSSSAEVQLVSKSSSDVVSMKVTNQKGTYTIVPVTTQNLTTSGSSTTTTNYNVEELTGYPIDTSLTSSVIQNGYSLTATKEIGTVSSLADYGLTTPQATVLVTFKDGSTYGYKIGNQTATSSASYYMCGDKSDTVYIVSVNSGLMEAPAYFLEKNMITVASSSTSSSTTSSSSSTTYDFAKIVLSGSVYPTGVTLEASGTSATGAQTMNITAPAQYTANTDNLSTLEGCLETVTADSVIMANPDAAALEKYGFNDPLAVVEYTVNDESHKLTIGAKDDTTGEYYAMADNLNIIYSVTASSVSGIVTQNLFALRSKMIYLPSITTVKKITVTYGGKTTDMVISRTEKTDSTSSATTSSDSEPEYDYTVTVDGQELDYDKNFRYTYERMISLSITDDAQTIPEGSPAVEIRYEYFDNSDTDVIDLYASDTRRYTVAFNGKAFGVVTQSDVDTLTSTLTNFFAGETISSPF